MSGSIKNAGAVDLAALAVPAFASFLQGPVGLVLDAAGMLDLEAETELALGALFRLAAQRELRLKPLGCVLHRAALGGGLEASEAAKFVALIVQPGRIDLANMLAINVLDRCLYGLAETQGEVDDGLGKAKPGGVARSGDIKTGGSTGRKSSARSPSKASRRKRSKG